MSNDKLTRWPNRHDSTQRVHFADQVGFTLIELMVVVVILSIFAGMLVMSVGSSESRKNKAFYEHLHSSISYLRLLSAERMQPLGMSLQTRPDGRAQLQVMMLTHPYAHLTNPRLSTDAAKNSMELSGMSDQSSSKTPTWQTFDDPGAIALPDVPPNVNVFITQSQSSSLQTSQINPWFTGSGVPEVVWYGTGEASPARIEVRYQGRLVGDALQVKPDGQVVMDNDAAKQVDS